MSAAEERAHGAAQDTGMGPARDPFAPERWPRLPRPAGLGELRVAVTRASGAPAASGLRVEGALVLGETRGGVRVRFAHRAPRASAVAVQVNGWWFPDPVDGLDLEPLGDGWFAAELVLPADLCSTYGFLEHTREGDPPWWRDGLKGPGGGRPQRGRVPGGVLDLVRGESGPESVRTRHPLHELAACAPPGGAAWTGPRTRIAVLDAGADGVGGGERGDGGGVRRDGAASPGGRAAGAASPARPATGAASPDGDLPLLLLTDGEAHAERLGTVDALAALVRDGRLQPLVVALVDASTDRVDSLGGPDGQARWIVEELVPRLRRDGLVLPGEPSRRRRVAEDPTLTVVAGSSFGALTALFSVARAPEAVGCASAQSTSLWRYEHAAVAEALAAAARRAPVSVRLHAGRYEGTMAASAQDVVRVLEAAGCPCAPVTVHGGGHDWAWWRQAVLDDAVALLGPAPSAAAGAP